MTGTTSRALAAEAVGSAMLVAVVVGSGIAGERLADSDGLALLINAFATGAGLVALILSLGRASGAHFNPVVTVCDAILGGRAWRDAAAYVAAQLAGAFAGVALAHAMYGVPLLDVSSRARAGGAVWVSEVVATFGLLLVIWGCVRGARPAVTAFAVGGYIASAYFFTASTSFANPAVTFGRMWTDTFSGIRPVDAAAFIPAQFVGGVAATVLMRWLYPQIADDSVNVVVPDTAAGDRR